MNPKKFHKYCDYKGPTLIIIKSMDGENAFFSGKATSS